MYLAIHVYRNSISVMIIKRWYYFVVHHEKPFVETKYHLQRHTFPLHMIISKYIELVNVLKLEVSLSPPEHHRIRFRFLYLTNRNRVKICHPRDTIEFMLTAIIYLTVTGLKSICDLPM